MKAFLFTLLGFSFFLFQCGPGEVPEALDSPSEGEEGGAPAHEPLIGEPEGVDSGMDQSTEGESMEAAEAEEDSPGLQFTVEGFVFQVFESYTCTKEGSKTYIYELYESPVEGNPYLCYDLHKYPNCGESWDPEKGYCYHNAVNQAGFCRNNVEGHLTRKTEEGYKCGPTEPDEMMEDAGADDEAEGEGSGGEDKEASGGGESGDEALEVVE